MADQYLIYLRKSRKDRELELQTGVQDTLERHRRSLLTLAREQRLSIAGILEEVVTGDTIAERPQMQELLALVETGNYAGVLVMEVARLARGKSRDQGIVSETFQYSHTKIITPDKVYDPANEADEDYFEFGLFMSRQEYRMINKRLDRGRMASLNEGKYIAGTAPYGYEKYKLKGQKGYSLRIAQEQAEIVRRIFDLYTIGAPNRTGALKPIGCFTIANQLNAEGIPSPGGVQWTRSAVQDIIKNPVYIGMLRWAYRPIVKKIANGSVSYSSPVSDHPKLVPGIHPPLIDQKQWDAAQNIRLGSAHSRVPSRRAISNPLAGLVYCSVCGRSMVQITDGRTKTTRLMCPTVGCSTVSHSREDVEADLLRSLRAWLDDYKLQAIERVSNQAPEADQFTLAVTRLEKRIAALHGQQDRLYDLLEQGIYTSDVFVDRSSKLAAQMSEAEHQLQDAERAAANASKANKIRKNLVPEIEHILAVYNSLATAAEKNALLKNSIAQVIYEKQEAGIHRGPQPMPKLYLFPKTE